jgi:hypothetical protein
LARQPNELTKAKANMCNAWNHPADCNCGWGGDGHFGGGGFGGYGGYGGGGGGSTYRSTFEGEVFEFPFVTYPSYVNPNARCPVCGADVYFYQSPYGGRVFFDDLGPPWPKHPCTDNPIVRHHFSSAESRARFLITTKIQPAESDSQTGESELTAIAKLQAPVSPPRLVEWVEAGWMPFIVSRIVTRQIGIEAEGKLFVSADGEPLAFKIIQTSSDARFYRTQGQLQIGFSLIQNPSPVLGALNESPILLKKDPDLEHLTLSSFILTREGEIEGLTLTVGGQLIAKSGQEAKYHDSVLEFG